MPRAVDYTIAYQTGQQVVDLCKILFGGDGSYYITAPYHPQNRAIAAKVTVNYAQEDNVVELETAEELAVVDDDDRRLKVSHHPDGFLQFSGQGIRSGLTESGRPRGIGTFSWPLAQPTLGPSFQLGFSNPVACGRPSLNRPRTVVLPESEIEHMRPPSIEGLSITGYFFPVRWREFVYRDADGNWWMNLLHPNAQAMKPLRILLASLESDLPGLIGIEARPHSLEFVDGQPAFFVTTSSGNLRRDSNGDLLGDQLLCTYPPPDLALANVPSLNFALPAPPYRASPGTTEIFPVDDATER